MMEEPAQKLDPPESAAEAWRNHPVALGIATVGGLGHLPLAPGTWGTIAALPGIWLASGLSFPVRLGLLAAVTALAIPASTRTGTALGDHDSSRIVVDEFVGMAATLVWFSPLDWPILATGFVAFRLLDVAKPPGARWCHDCREDGLGVVGDDLAAGLWAAGVVALAKLLV